MSLKQEIDRDLKAALLSGDKSTAETLRGLKSAILYKEVEAGKRDNGLSDAEIIVVLQKESKKRDESAALYKQGGNTEKHDQEMAEKSIIGRYLPKGLTQAEIEGLVDQAEMEIGAIDSKNLGQIIGWVKQKSQGAADGSVVAMIVKGRIKE